MKKPVHRKYLGPLDSELQKSLDSIKKPSMEAKTLTLPMLEKLVHLANRIADYSCEKPFGVLCSHHGHGEQSCPPCMAREIIDA